MADIGWGDQVGDFADKTNPSTIRRLEIIKDMYTKIGLGDLFDTIILDEIIRDPKQSSREILRASTIQNSEVYKERFTKTNDSRVTNGYKPLDPLEFVQLEETYKQYMGQAGLPKGFYDEVSDHRDWIAKGVSPAEVQGRVQVASDAYQALQANDPGQLQAMSDLFGVGRDGVMAYFLDPDRALSVLDKQQQLAATKVAGAGNNFGVKTTADQAMNLAGKGVSEQEARQSYRMIADESAGAERLGSLYGEAVTQGDLVTEQFGLDGAAKVTDRKKRLASQERAAFSGTSGIGQGSLSQRKSGL